MRKLVALGLLGLCSLLLAGCSQSGVAMSVMERGADKWHRRMICMYWKKLTPISYAKFVSSLCKMKPRYLLLPCSSQAKGLVNTARLLENIIDDVVYLVLDTKYLVNADQLNDWTKNITQKVEGKNKEIELMISHLSTVLNQEIARKQKQEVAQALKEKRKFIKDKSDPRFAEEVKQLIQQGPLKNLNELHCKYGEQIKQKTNCLCAKIEVLFSVVQNIEETLDSLDAKTLSDRIQEAINDGLVPIVSIHSKILLGTGLLKDCDEASSRFLTGDNHSILSKMITNIAHISLLVGSLPGGFKAFEDQIKKLIDIPLFDLAHHITVKEWRAWLDELQDPIDILYKYFSDIKVEVGKKRQSEECRITIPE